MFVLQFVYNEKVSKECIIGGLEYIYICSKSTAKIFVGTMSEVATTPKVLFHETRKCT